MTYLNRSRAVRYLSAAVLLADFTFLPDTLSLAQNAAGGRGGNRAQPAFHEDATLAQLMKGILFPSSNVIFFAQSENPNDVKPGKDPSLATDPLANTYGKWQAVENSGLAIAEASNLLLLPGRKCSNGRDVPISNPDWAGLVAGVREAGLKAYKAAQTKDQDKILDAADTLSTACSNCHEKYREKPERCK